MWRLIFLLVLFGCSPSSLEDFQKEGEALSRKIIKELQGIHTTEMLLEHAPVLKKRFYTLVELMIEARTFQESNPEGAFDDQTAPARSFNELFMIELTRIYALERGREIIEDAQRDALHRLDAFERGFKKRREKVLPER